MSLFDACANSCEFMSDGRKRPFGVLQVSKMRAEGSSMVELVILGRRVGLTYLADLSRLALDAHPKTSGLPNAAVAIERRSPNAPAG